MEKLETADGSFTYAHPEHGATYRSLGGALTESRHVFVAGSRMRDSGSWRVLELGFGTGLNFAATLEQARMHGVELTYVSLDCRPLDPQWWLVPAEWRLGPGRHVHGGVTLELLPVLWQQQQVAPRHFDAYYHDPFGPRVSPDCWTVDCFRWAGAALKAEGRLLTYGAASAARSAMRESGLVVARAPGAGRKREMTVASPSLQALEGLKLWKR